MVQVLAEGIFIFLIGLFKKVIIADFFKIWADAGFNSSESLSFVKAWTTSLSFTFQIYFDFSGYTDMAVGLGRMFGVRLPENFDSPYKALSLQDFWRRWHMTLSRFLRDYVYIPLGGNRKGSLRLYVNLIITFLIAGIWHGAGWTFVLWGFVHGFGLAVQRFSTGTLRTKVRPSVSWLLTFVFVSAAWVLFRANTLTNASRVFKGMTGMTGFRPADLWNSKYSRIDWLRMDFVGVVKALNASLESTLILGCAALLVLVAPNSHQISQKFRPSLGYLFVSVLALVSLLFLWGEKHVSEFIYFAF